MFHDVSKVVLGGTRNTFASFSEDALHFSWQAQHFGDHVNLRGVACVVLRILCELHCRAARSADNVQIPWHA